MSCNFSDLERAWAAKQWIQSVGNLCACAQGWEEAGSWVCWFVSGL